jgi:hypothetical protein
LTQNIDDGNNKSPLKNTNNETVAESESNNNDQSQANSVASGNNSLLPRSLAMDQPTLNVSPVTDTSRASLPQAVQKELLWNWYKTLHVQENRSELGSDGKRRRSKCCICDVFVCSDQQGSEPRDCLRKHILQRHPKSGLVLD